MSNGQQLRWWQDKEENQAAQQASERVTSATATLLPDAKVLPATEQVTLAEEVPDTWAELEAEALRRSQQGKTEEGEEVSFYLDATIVLARHRRNSQNSVLRVTTLVFGIFIVYVLVATIAPEYRSSLPSPAAFAGFAGALPGLIIQSVRRGRWLRNLDKPVVRLSPEGIHIDTLDQPNVLLLWADVTAVKPKSLFKERYLEIHGTNRRQFVILEQDLPLAPEFLAARITDYKAAREID